MKLSVKFRTKGYVPFAIEKLNGIQYRCGVCGEVFFSRSHLDKHLRREKKVSSNKLKFPDLNKVVSVRVLYTQDLNDCINPEYPKLKRGDQIFQI